MSEHGLRICLISVHGLIRADALELGRDADTGGQVLYVVELARALANHDDVAHVDLITRCIRDPNVGAAYGLPVEQLAPKASIVRIAAGGDAYIPKEQLWEHLYSFVDNLHDYYSHSGQKPDVVHSHYADAGYVGCRLSYMLGVPLVHTGHSLGRVKRRRLLASGIDHETVDKTYNMRKRLKAA